MPRVILTQISSRAWEHPADRAALNTLRAIPGFDEVVKKVAGFSEEELTDAAFPEEPSDFSHDFAEAGNRPQRVEGCAGRGRLPRARGDLNERDSAGDGGRV